jgi:mRNA-degrading endonuclease toxin of MazEF toxin-antitoxin module
MKIIRENPSAGLVVRYDYLWKRESIFGQSEGAKTRPCAVVLPMPIKPDGRQYVLVVAITHSAPSNHNDAIELPPKVKRQLGLDDAQSWIVVSEVNVADWSDAGFMPVDKDRWSYGSLPKSLTIKLRDLILARAKAKSLSQTNRAMPPVAK